MMSIMLDPETDLKLECIVDVPRQLVWECWTTPEHIKQFFVPLPHRVKHCEIDLRVGGRFNTLFEVDGNEMENNGVWLEVVDGKKLVFTDTYTEGWKPNPEPFMTAILLLEDAENGTTRYTAIARHRSAEARKQHEEMGFHEGWGIVVKQLEAYAHKLMKK
ncbi:uncharacterized protein YndB with AHSA1/START domain [Yokenella regensburgei]|uniref:Activator of Hsp90 ATPase homolog 1-like protein n=1 Tax=Yokenella regensburgei TaxID=158877 RepID=A0AB38FTW8_9ENTR|nr:uncharacterized protein YndB with AHSA1/START domain [Yokenella regensburgei]KFD20779.1 putative glutathione S-transferase-related transmembrane protein [Yokenella regensburgei ATCC 49455]RKR64497.1 uncharacterized protein YndB with AHSA1/START domain [Yokenella regensburgei]SQA61029.1 Activator of Hsp90 ATPase homolog 1-like protein [Yokenella regensburgei]SQA66975.1 Activator of Hsp90 ATPase homolog 1-like protein [Yokenella regensburgei]